MDILTPAAVDREIDLLTMQFAELSVTLVELDGHPGRQHVRRYEPTGATAVRWEQVEESLAHLWEDVTAATSALQSAQRHRNRRSRLRGEDLAELTRILRGLGAGPGTMRDQCTEVAKFFDDVNRVDTSVANGVGPLLGRLDAAGAPVPEPILDLLTVAATDPLAMTAEEVERRCAELAELVSMQVDWTAAVATTAAQLDALHEAGRRAAQTRADVERNVIAGPLPQSAETEADLRADLASMTVPDPAALRSLRRRIESALRVVRSHEALAQGLLDRRDELTGRLRSYEAKAARLGLADDRDCRASRQIATGLLLQRPCDLRAVTRAIADYQQTLAEKRGSR